MANPAATTKPAAIAKPLPVICYVVPHWQVLSAGKPVKVDVCIANQGEHEIMIAEGQGDHSFEVVATCNGTPIVYKHANEPYVNDGIVYGLMPGEVERRPFELSSIFDMSAPGTYEFRFSARIVEDENSIKCLPDAIATAVVVIKGN